MRTKRTNIPVIIVKLTRSSSFHCLTSGSLFLCGVVPISLYFSCLVKFDLLLGLELSCMQFEPWDPLLDSSREPSETEDLKFYKLIRSTVPIPSKIRSTHNYVLSHIINNPPLLYSISFDIEAA
jgi:hypothetical protein